MSGAGGSGAGPMMGGSAACMTALQSQLRELLQAPPPGVNAGPADEEDMLTWIGTIQGQPGTPYEGGLFMLDLRFPPTYPFDPPHVRFATPIYHPNVNDKGEVCLSILFKTCSWDRGWSPALSVSSVLLSLLVLLAEPNTEHSLRPELAALYDNDRAAYEAAAREHTRQHAM